MQFERVEIICATVLFSLIAAFVYVVYQGEQEWQAFMIQHHCVVVAKETGTTFTTTGFSTSGNMTVGVASSPSKTSWLCDDGVMYTR